MSAHEAKDGPPNGASNRLRDARVESPSTAARRDGLKKAPQSAFIEVQPDYNVKCDLKTKHKYLHVSMTTLFSAFICCCDSTASSDLVWGLSETERQKLS